MGRLTITQPPNVREDETKSRKYVAIRRWHDFKSTVGFYRVNWRILSTTATIRKCRTHLYKEEVTLFFMSESVFRVSFWWIIRYAERCDTVCPPVTTRCVSLLLIFIQEPPSNKIVQPNSLNGTKQRWQWLDWIVPDHQNDEPAENSSEKKKKAARQVCATVFPLTCPTLAFWNIDGLPSQISARKHAHGEKHREKKWANMV